MMTRYHCSWSIVAVVLGAGCSLPTNPLLSGRTAAPAPPPQRSQLIVMPDVKGMSPDDAERALKQAGFVSIARRRQFFEGCKPGTVCETAPKAGTKALPRVPKTLYIGLSSKPKVKDPDATDDGDSAATETPPNTKPKDKGKGKGKDDTKDGDDDDDDDDE